MIQIDGKIDVCLYDGKKPDSGKDIQYLKIGSDVMLENGSSGNIVVNPHLSKEWDENRDYLYPIPSNERSLNPHLTQNPGWNDGLDFQPKQSLLPIKPVPCPVIYTG